MTDIVDKRTRARIMSRIRGRDTGPEIALRKSLHRMGFRYRLHSSKLPGRPDLVLSGRRAVVFVHGCFWHRHAECRFATTPASNVDFWKEKFKATVLRDVRVHEELRNLGWRVATVWECVLNGSELSATSHLVGSWLEGHEPVLELPPTA